jgi:hypothetical protein
MEDFTPVGHPPPAIGLIYLPKVLLLRHLRLGLAVMAWLVSSMP